MRSTIEVLGIIRSATSWVLCGRSRITAVTFNGTVELSQVAAAGGHGGFRTEMDFPMGLPSPKYLRATDCERITDSGFASAARGSPETSGRGITCRKFGSTTATVSVN